MSGAREALAALLWALGGVELLALGAVVMPRAWMAEAHAWLGLGTLPEAPVVGYLARSASWLYALHGATVLYAAHDLPRHWGLVRFLGAAAVAQGLVLAAVGLAEGIPPWWALGDHLGLAATGVLILVLHTLAGPPRD
jgi:hypothetical protein